MDFRSATGERVISILDYEQVRYFSNWRMEVEHGLNGLTLPIDSATARLALSPRMIFGEDFVAD